MIILVQGNLQGESPIRKGKAPVQALFSAHTSNLDNIPDGRNNHIASVLQKTGAYELRSRLPQLSLQADEFACMLVLLLLVAYLHLSCNIV